MITARNIYNGKQKWPCHGSVPFVMLDESYAQLGLAAEFETVICEYDGQEVPMIATVTTIYQS
jgi:hypothetical protein